MASNWGDFNGDGKTNYVDYKIFTTQVDPYSNEYQRRRTSSGGGGLGAYYLIVFIILFIYAFFIK